MGILCAVVEAFVLAVLDARHDLPLGGRIASQLVGNQHTRRAALLLQQLAQQAFGGLLIAPALDEDIENEAFLIDGAPEPVLFAGDGDDDLIKVPFVAATTTDGRELHLTRYTQPEPDLQLLIQQLKLELPPQPPPRITAAAVARAT